MKWKYATRANAPRGDAPWEDPDIVVGVSPPRLVETLRHLRSRQIAGQLRYRLRGLYEDPARAARVEAPARPQCRWRPRASFLPPAAVQQTTRDLLRGEFRFLNRTWDLGWPPRWDPAGASHLWAYNLHYFEFLWSLPFDAAKDLALDWMRHHTPGRGRVGWGSYPISLRLQNWCAYFFGDHLEETRADDELCDALWQSIFSQAEWLCGHLETHLLGNHLLENAAALALCGSCFAGSSAARWAVLGQSILSSEIAEQVLPDGGHFERSPMYQLRVAWVLIALQNSGDETLRALVDGPLRRTLTASLRLCHPDGDVALLNDAASGVYPRAADLVEWWSRASGAPAESLSVGLGVFSLPETGYFGARSESGHYLVCDAGMIGPDYMPGHSHGDIFSFELSLSGHRVVCDTGVFGYEADSLRHYCRLTRAHNTVELSGQDQCEFWSAFRVARRGRPRDVTFEAQAEGFRLEGWHDGYERLPGRPRHHREFRWMEGGTLLVRDRLSGRAALRAASRLHLHPSCALEDLEAGVARVRFPGGRFWVGFAGQGTLEVERSIHCPEFGVKLENRALVFSTVCDGSDIESAFCITTRSGDDARTLSQSLLLS